MLSIVYLTCNRCGELKESILSCEKHVSVEHEYVVVDNASTVETEGMITELIKKGLKINYLKQSINTGVAGGRNIGFNAAQGEVCYFIDDDAVVQTEGLCIDKAYIYLINSDSVFGLGTDCWDTEKNKQLVGHPEKGHSFNSDSEILHYIGCSHFVKKTGLNIDYLYPKNLIYGAEELYMGLRLAGLNKTVRQFTGLKIIHSPSKSTRTSPKERSRNIYINSYVVKSYYLPVFFKPLSKLMFFLRLIKFEGINPRVIINDMETARERTDNVYEHTMQLNQTISLIKKFGFNFIV